MRVVGKVQEGCQTHREGHKEGFEYHTENRQLGKDWMCELVLKYLETGK